MKYRYLEHTADVKFRAYGKTTEEKFANAVSAMMSVMVDTKEVKGITTKKIAATGSDLPSLLQNFLEQFLILLDAENLFLVKVEKLKIRNSDGNYGLTAEASGDDAGKYETIGPQVKAVTYNDMAVNDEFIQVVVDI